MNTKPYEKRVIVYCRQSRDEGGVNYHRIETQRDLLLDFCRRNSLCNIIKIIMDDDVSGTDFSRFEEIKSMAARRQFDVIVFKDSSRLGRNQIESLMLVNFFEECGIEIVFENERFDSDLFPIFAWFNEQRAKDDSLKIRRSLKHKIQRGELIIRPHFGYKVSQGRLCFSDDIVTVREIFKLFLSGKTIRETADVVGMSPSKVRRILKNPVYSGVYVGGVYMKQSFKSKKIIKLPEEEWVVIENHHPAAVSSEDFQKASKLLSLSSRNTKSDTLRRLLFCRDCEYRMIRVNNHAFVCSKYHSKGKAFCSSHRIRREDLICILKICLAFICCRGRTAYEHSDGFYDGVDSGRTVSFMSGLFKRVNDGCSGYLSGCCGEGCRFSCRVIEDEAALHVKGGFQSGAFCGKISDVQEKSELFIVFLGCIRRIEIISRGEIIVYF